MSYRQMQGVKKRIHYLEKHLQDLNEELSRVNEENLRLRKRQQNGETAVTKPPVSKLREPTSDRPGMQDFLRPPRAHRANSSQPRHTNPAHRLPLKHEAHRLLLRYKATIHHDYPAIHLETFERQFESLYRHGTFENPAWAAVFYAILACGSVADLPPGSAPQDSAGVFYIEKCILGGGKMVMEEFSLDSTRAALLVSIFFMKVDEKSMAWVWLHAAIRNTLAISLAMNAQQRPPNGEEMWERVRWSVYKLER